MDIRILQFLNETNYRIRTASDEDKKTEIALTALEKIGIDKKLLEYYIEMGYGG